MKILIIGTVDFVEFHIVKKLLKLINDFCYKHSLSPEQEIEKYTTLYREYYVK